MTPNIDKTRVEDTEKGIIQTEVTGEMKKSYLDYAMSVIVSRAIPSIELVLMIDIHPTMHYQDRDALQLVNHQHRLQPALSPLDHDRALQLYRSCADALCHRFRCRHPEAPGRSGDGRTGHLNLFDPHRPADHLRVAGEP